MKQPSGKKDLDEYIESVKDSQKGVLWPDVLQGGRSIDELLWKGARNAPLVQRIGVVILAVAYLMVAVVFVSMAVEKRSWFAGSFAVILLRVGGLFIRNAFRSG